MVSRFISRIKFLLKSTNQHGIHSPFVYDFTTKGLYKKNFDSTVLHQFDNLEDLTPKEKIVLSKIVTYFKNHTQYNLNPVYFPSISDLKNRKHELMIKNNYLIVKGIHKNKNEQMLWNEVVRDNLASVTIDLYYFGLIFIRHEQEKEHFIIRV